MAPHAAPLSPPRDGGFVRTVAMAPQPSALAAALAVLAVHGPYLWLAGVRLAPDTRSYAYWARRLIESGFDYAGLLAQADVGFPALLYALFATLVAGLQLLFGEGWPTALVALNVAAHVGLGVLIVRVALVATGSALAGWAALALFLACFDLLQWVSFALSDATFALLAFAIFTLAAARILDRAKGWGAVIAPAIAGLLYRPTGIVLLPDLLWAYYLSKRPAPVVRGRVALALAGVAIAALLAFAWLMQDPSRWPFAPLSGAFELVAQGYAQGEVVSARLETYHAAPLTLTDFAAISLDRFVHFFALGGADYSLSHLLASAIFYVPSYLLSGWLLVALWRRNTAFSAAQRKLFAAAAGAVLAYACFHALIQIDYDWRYRTPILAHLILLAAGGAADLARRAAAR